MSDEDNPRIVAVPKEQLGEFAQMLAPYFQEAILKSVITRQHGEGAELLLNQLAGHGVEPIAQPTENPLDSEPMLDIDLSGRIKKGRYKMTPFEMTRIVDAANLEHRYLLTQSLIDGQAQMGDVITDWDILLGTAADFQWFVDEQNTTPTDWSKLLDNNNNTFIKNIIHNVGDAGAGPSFTMRFRGTRLISRIVLTGQVALPTAGCHIDVTDVRGLVHRVHDATVGSVETNNANLGLDSGNFGPLEASSVTFTFVKTAATMPADTVQINRVLIRRAFEVKVGNAVREEDNIILDDIDHFTSSITNFTGTLSTLFDGDRNTFLTGTLGVVSAVNIWFNKPQLISRIAVTAQRGVSGVGNISNTRIRIIGTTDAVVATPLDNSLVGAQVRGEDTGNFAPLLANGIIVDFTNPAAAIQLAEVVIWNTEEVKINLAAGGALPIKPSTAAASCGATACGAGVDVNITLAFTNSGGINIDVMRLITTFAWVTNLATKINYIRLYADVARTIMVKQFQPGAVGTFIMDSDSFIPSNVAGSLFATINCTLATNVVIVMAGEEMS